MTNWKKRNKTKSLTAESLGNTGLASRPRSKQTPEVQGDPDDVTGGAGPAELCSLAMVLNTRCWTHPWI